MPANVQHLVEQKLPETIRSVLQENTELKTRLSQLSEVARSLQVENAALRERKRALSVDADILEEMVRETSRISCIRKKVREQFLQHIVFRLRIRSSADWSRLHQEVQRITAKFQQLQEEEKEKRQRLEQLRTEHGRVLADMEAIRSELLIEVHLKVKCVYSTV